MVIEKIIANITAETCCPAEEIFSDSSVHKVARTRSAFIHTVKQLFPGTTMTELMSTFTGIRHKSAYYYYEDMHDKLMDRRNDDTKALEYRDLVEDLQLTFPNLERAQKLVDESLNERTAAPVYKGKRTLSELPEVAKLVVTYIGNLMRLPVDAVYASRARVSLRIAAAETLKRLFPQVNNKTLAPVIQKDRSNLYHMNKILEERIYKEPRSLEAVCFRELVAELLIAFPS